MSTTIEEGDPVEVNWPSATDFHEETGQVAEKNDQGGYGFMYVVKFADGRRRQFARHHLVKIDQGTLFPTTDEDYE